VSRVPLALRGAEACVRTEQKAGKWLENTRVTTLELENVHR
jgi:hypothetical protein